MFIRRRSLPRRSVLRGTAVTLGLPLLDAMVPALTATAKTAAKPVTRLGVVYAPNGVTMSAWTPQATGSAFELSPILLSLAPFREQLVVVSGLSGGAGGNGHNSASTAFLTGVSADGPTRGVSIDQLAANEFGKETQLASLELSLDASGTSEVCDGQSCSLQMSLSWRTPTLQLPTEHDPRVIFERLFGDSGTTDSATRLARLRKDRSILDSVIEGVADLQRGLGPGDRRKVVEYLESVRDVERRIQRGEEQSARELPVVSRPNGFPATFEEYAKLMFDLQVLAYQCDLTRVITFMFGRELSARTYPELGITDSHHTFSHHQNDPGKIALIAKLNAYHISMFAYYVEKLRSTADGDGSLLDNSLLFYGGGLSDGNIHDMRDLPMLLLGGKRLVKGGRHLKYHGEVASNLLLSIMDMLGLPIEKIGDSTRELNIDTLSGV